ncbi:MAG: PAS domain S-box protein [Flavobacteriaceae bacterium]|nr:PAS domain S-box protein [Flavobacteriaceae bacterium]
MNKKFVKNILRLLLLAIVFISSTVAMLEWLVKSKFYFTVNDDGATTKFNTALLFFLAVLSLLISNLKQKKSRILFFTLSTVILIISTLTILQYVFTIDLLIDNLFMKDTITKELPGRMSEATAFCFMLFSIGIMSSKSNSKNLLKVTQHIPISIIMLSFISLISFGLRIPIDSKTVFFKTMSIQTSLTFIFIAVLLFYKFPYFGIKRAFLSEYSGSKLLRKLLPYVILIPFLLSYVLLSLINNNYVEEQFGIILYTIALIIFSFSYTFISAVSLNRSERKRKDLETDLLVKNQELYQFKDALDEIAIVAITDENAVIKYVNDNFCKISKYSREEILGNTSLIVRSDHHPESYFWDAWYRVASGKPWFGEIKNKAKDGSHYWTDTAVVPLKNKGGNIKEFMSIQLDITKRKEAEELLNSKYVKTLEQKNKELEQFSYITSHDLQEPLRTITSFSDIIHEEYYDKLDDHARQIFTFIKKATTRMSNLIKNLLDYSRIGHKEELVDVDCNLLIKEVKSDLTNRIQKTNTLISTNNLPIIKGYPTGLRLLFQNLISNAIKFSKKDVAPIIIISCEKKENYWKFSIRDNGIGIEKEHQKKIFSIFQRLHLKEEYEGTGIGLAHCQKIIGLHGGEISVKSKPNEGSTFYFTIPHNN